jgi:hypothetical protein
MISWDPSGVDFSHTGSKVSSGFSGFGSEFGCVTPCETVVSDSIDILQHGKKEITIHV